MEEVGGSDRLFKAISAIRRWQKLKKKSRPAKKVWKWRFWRAGRRGRRGGGGPPTLRGLIDAGNFQRRNAPKIPSARHCRAQPAGAFPGQWRPSLTTGAIYRTESPPPQRRVSPRTSLTLITGCPVIVWPEIGDCTTSGPSKGEDLLSPPQTAEDV